MVLRPKKFKCSRLETKMCESILKLILHLSVTCRAHNDMGLAVLWTMRIKLLFLQIQTNICSR